MTTIPAAPTLRIIRRDRGKDTWASDLQSAINRARPGDVVLLTPGRYPKAAVVSVSGTKGKPITIRGPKTGTAVLDGGRPRDDGRHSGLDPMDDDFAFLKLIQAEHIVLERFTFENCWPTAIFIRAAKDIAIRDCNATGSRFFTFARQYDFRPTKRLILERINWVQDPDHDMWDGRVTWPEIKARPGHYDASFFNGALFGSFDIEGQVIIRDCEVAHAFNAIRMDVRKKRIKRRKDGPTITRNRDVAIYHNKFAFIRDNAIEPEKGAEDWRVFNNRFFNVHAAFSLDRVAARDLFYIGNWILNSRRPGLVGQPNQSGKIFKFLGPPDEKGKPKPRPRKGLWSIFNSVQTRTVYAKKGRTTEWNDAYNAVGLYAAEHPDKPGPPRPVFFGMFWNDKISIRGMATNDATFPKAYENEGAKTHGFRAIGKVFDVKDFDIDPSLPLGGWDGLLPKTRATRRLKSQKLVIDRRRGGPLTFAAGLQPGAHPVEELGLSDWLKDSN
jgi:hypothetical protein